MAEESDAIPKGIGVKWKANCLLKDLNCGRRF